ncbi:MAG TPA: tetratricopeptide repeat protein [Gallionella sp.]|nr:tetratricopeptide repeat protein [Gallionella sp.]
MKNRVKFLSAVSIIPLLSACASDSNTANREAWAIRPVYNVRHSTETPTSYYQLGRYYQGQNRYQQALSAYQKALEIDGSFVEARNGMGVVFARQGRLPEAIEQFSLAERLAPNAAHIRNNLGYALYLSRSYAAAASELERAVALEPSNQSARFNLALALDKAGDTEQAVQVMAQAAKAQFSEKVPTVDAQRVPADALSLAPASAVTPPPTPAPMQVSALPKDRGVIAQAAPKPVALVESRSQSIPLAPSVYEQRVRADARVVPAAGSLQQISAQPKEPDRVVVQAAYKPVPAVSVSPVLSARGLTEPQTLRAAAPTAKPYRIEVSNGNGVAGLARKVAGFLDGEGYSGARLTNQKTFKVASSQVQYRSGFREQAQSLVLTLPGQPGIAQVEDLRRDISIRVVLGKDVASNVASFEHGQDKVRLARQE